MVPVTLPVLSAGIPPLSGSQASHPHLLPGTFSALTLCLPALGLECLGEAGALGEAEGSISLLCGEENWPWHP